MWRTILTGMLVAACIMLTIELARNRRSRAVISRGNVIRAAGLPELTEARGALSFRFAELNIHSVTLEQAIANIAERAHASIDVRWGTLENAGVSRTTRVRLHLWNVTLAQALTAVLDGAASSGAAAEYRIVNGIIVVGPDTDVAPDSMTVVYNVRDLIGFEEANGSTHEEAVDMLAKVITETVIPESWRDAGGNIGSLHELLSGLLVITHTADGHEQILRLLEQLRSGDRLRPIRPEERRPSEHPAGGATNMLFGGTAAAPPKSGLGGR